MALLTVAAATVATGVAETGAVASREEGEASLVRQRERQVGRAARETARAVLQAEATVVAGTAVEQSVALAVGMVKEAVETPVVVLKAAVAAVQAVAVLGSASEVEGGVSQDSHPAPSAAQLARAAAKVVMGAQIRMQSPRICRSLAHH